MTAFVSRLAPTRLPRPVWFALGACVAVAAALAAPSTTLLPAPGTHATKLLAAVALFAAFAFGLLRPLPALYCLVALTVLEGAIRKWLVNDIDVFLLKDFLCVGMYATVLPRISRQEWRRPWWLLAPLIGILALALLQGTRSPSLSEAVVGLRSYVIYVPLLWVGPVLLRPASQAVRLLCVTLALGVAEAVFSVVQALSQSATLNKLVSGALPAVITLNHVSYLRPSGTFMQSGTLAVFLFVALLTSFSLVGVYRSGVLYVAGLVAPIFLMWGLVYAAARSLFGAAFLALVALLCVLLARRRFISFLLVPGAMALGFVLLFTLVPRVDDGVHAVGLWWRERGKTTVAIVDATTKHKFTVYMDPSALARARILAAERHSPVTLTGFDSKGRTVVVTIAPPPRGKQPSAKNATGSVEQHKVTAVDETGVVRSVVVEQPKSASQVSGFLGRSADLNKAGGTQGLWGSRVKPQLELIKAQRLGHGTGTMTLGSEYASRSAQISGESQYSKLAWELGLPGLLLYVWFVVAFAACALVGFLRARADERLPAAVGFGIAALAPVWAILTFAPDFPIFGIFIYLFGGYAVSRFARASIGSGPERA
jgi:hypothetical protein